jgi:hypothetical protein
VNDEEMEMQIRLAHEQTSTRPIGPTPTVRLQAVKAHEHSFQVATSNLTSIRFCTTCGTSWILKPILRQFKPVQQWEQILETD